ncbi:unnamed protein product [Cunninghamella blakesleeana]
MISFPLLLLFHVLILYNNHVKGQTVTGIPTPPEPTSYQNNPTPPQQDESWLKQNNRFVFVIILGLLALVLIFWYIYKSIKGMRKRLKKENEAQRAMIEQATAYQYNNHNSNNQNTMIPPTSQHPLSSSSSSSISSPTSPTTTANTTNVINNNHQQQHHHHQKDQISYPEKVQLSSS